LKSAVDIWLRQLDHHWPVETSMDQTIFTLYLLANVALEWEFAVRGWRWFEIKR
jgi:hypothetical protein